MSRHRKILTCMIVLGLLLFMQQSTYGWNDTGHMLVARVAWDNLSAAAQQRMVALLLQAPKDSCLRELFPNDARPLLVRQREFFMLAATWPDVIRPGKNDTRKCIKYHQRDWHFVDHFWSGTSGSMTDKPHDVSIPIDEINAGERLHFFRALLACNCNLPANERAMALAWMLHLVGDIHQPLHTSGRVTTFPGESHGDAGGNLFKLEPGPNPKKNLHSYWDQIIDNYILRQSNENYRQYIERLSEELEHDYPPSTFNGTLKPGKIDEWILESLGKAKANAYPEELDRKEWPKPEYGKKNVELSHKSIAQAGYRLANMLSQLFGS
jgi:hypothetical protein